MQGKCLFVCVFFFNRVHYLWHRGVYFHNNIKTSPNKLKLLILNRKKKISSETENMIILIKILI